jgi:hypothetical protein
MVSRYSAVFREGRVVHLQGLMNIRIEVNGVFSSCDTLGTNCDQFAIRLAAGVAPEEITAKSVR